MAVVKIRIKRKSLHQDFSPIFRDIIVTNEKTPIHESFGILTACSRSLFIGLQVLISSIVYRYSIPVQVMDVGMSPDQIAWCKRQPQVSVVSFRYPFHGKHISYAGAWFKSHYIEASPFEHTIWIDCDTVLLGDLEELIEWSHPKALFTSDHTQLRHSTLNQFSLYSYLPTGKSYYHDIPPYLNSGVMVVNKKHDEKVLADWRFCVEQACSIPEVANAISCWDQGALKWALHKNDLLYLIVPDRKFNYPAKIRHFAYPTTDEAVIYWINSMKPQDSCVVMHWMGSPKPWANWGDFISLDLSKL